MIQLNCFNAKKNTVEKFQDVATISFLYYKSLGNGSKLCETIILPVYRICYCFVPSALTFSTIGLTKIEVKLNIFSKGCKGRTS